MSLTLLAPINLPSARSELVKFEITCSGRLVQPRPTLLTHDSSVSSHSVSTESSVSSSRKNRPSLSPEALLTHAFGPAARNRLTPALEPGSKICSEGRASSLPLSSSLPFTASRAPSRSSKGNGKSTHDYHPQPPPLGTFRSVPKSSNLIRRSEGKLPLSEMMPFHPSSSESQDRSQRIIPCCQCECNLEREPLMSPEIWREKVEERRQRRRLLRLKTPKNEPNEPLGIDCRPMKGSSHVPPLADNSVEGKSGSNKQIYPSPVLADLINDMLKKCEEGSLMENDKKPLAQENMSSRRSSMVEMQEIRNLVKQCDSIRLENSQN